MGSGSEKTSQSTDMAIAGAEQRGAAGPNRRTSPRRRACFPVKVTSEGGTQQGLLHDRSEQGLCVFKVSAEEGARVTVRIADEELEGTVRWTHHHRVGIELDHTPDDSTEG